MRRRVVITGVGVITPAGFGLDAFRGALLAGRSLTRAIDRFDASTFPTRIAAAVDERLLPPCEAGIDRITRFATLAAGDALADAGLDSSQLDREQAGLVTATGMGTYGHREVFAACARAGGNGAIDWNAFHETLRAELEPRSAARRTPGSVPALLAARHRMSGPAMSVMTACAGGTQAIGDAARLVREGRADVMLAGGADSELYPMGLASFCLLGALSRRNDDPERASRPFDRARDGFVIGEGAGFLVLEEREHALRRGARVRAEVSGFASSSDAFRVTDPHPDGAGAVLAMRGALDDAGVDAARVGYVNAHGTSTAANDRIETKAIRAVFGEHAGRLAVSSTKSIIGHLTVAAGAVEAIACVLMLEGGFVHPTANLEEPDPECDLDFVPGDARRVVVEHALSNSFAFGGQCASLLLRRVEEVS